jgi:hypothetical protein
MVIEPRRWSEYLAELSRQAEGYLTTIEILSEELGDQIETRRAPLRELAFDPREGIAISIGDAAGRVELLRHVIARPTAIEATDESGIPSTLLFADATGTKTLVSLAAP